MLSAYILKIVMLSACNAVQLISNHVLYFSPAVLVVRSVLLLATEAFSTISPWAPELINMMLLYGKLI